MFDDARLRRSFLRLFTPLALVLLVGGAALAWALIDGGEERLAARAEATARAASASLSGALSIYGGHIHTISGEPQVRAAIDDPSDAGVDGMVSAFTALLLHNAAYQQVRWIDERGAERVRVDREAGEIVVRDRLQDKSMRYYVRDALLTAPGTMQVSRLDLNVEHGEIETPYVRTLRMLVRVADRFGAPSGVIVVNLRMDSLLDALSGLGEAEDVDIALLSSAGDWLLSDDDGDEFAFMFADRGATLGERAPERWAAITSAASGRYGDRDGLWTWRQVEPILDARASSARANGTPWIVLTGVGRGRLLALYARVLVPTVLTVLALFFYFGALTWRLVREQHRLAVARDRAEEATAAKATFLAHMSHELRTPLTGILGIAELLRTSPLPVRERQHVDLILGSGKALLLLLNDILDLSKIEAKKLAVERIPFSLTRVLADVAAMMRLQAERKGLVLLVVDDDAPTAVVGDPTRLRQLLLNLIGNAIKFTERGHVELVVETLWREGDAAQVSFVIRDTGIGIPQERLGALFRSYDQVDGSIARRFGGTGLGLAISKQLVGLMGGEIGVRSELDVGSEFWFTLPLELTDADVGEAPVLPVRRADAGALRILVAEDNPVNQLILQGFLAKLGYDDVDVVADGRAAMGRLAERDYDLVLMDVHMPEVDGLEAVRWLRGGGSRARNIDVPVVALTASAMVGDAERFLAAGMTDYLPKPLTIEGLGATVERLTWPKQAVAS
ncbi:MAG: ATP-binding protein [Nannocystaceae bacterium]